MSVSPEILAKQAAYAARPFAVRWCDSHASGTYRFNTLDEAYEYIHAVWLVSQINIAEKANRCTMLDRSYLETPSGRVQLRYVLLCDDLSSYHRTVQPYTVEIRCGRAITRKATCNTAADAILLAKDWAAPYGEHVVAYDPDGELLCEHKAVRA